jgi:uncharacterized protein YbjT (DUF2867 family)
VILVTGATGQVGYRLLDRLDDLHADVTAMVRVEAKGADLPPTVKHVVGTFDDPPSPEVLQTFDRIFLLSPEQEAQVELEVLFIDALIRAGHAPHVVRVAADGFQDPDCSVRFMRNHREITTHLEPADSRSAISRRAHIWKTWCPQLTRFEWRRQCLRVLATAGSVSSPPRTWPR